MLNSYILYTALNLLHAALAEKDQETRAAQIDKRCSAEFYAISPEVSQEVGKSNLCWNVLDYNIRLLLGNGARRYWSEAQVLETILFVSTDETMTEHLFMQGSSQVRCE